MNHSGVCLSDGGCGVSFWLIRDQELAFWSAAWISLICIRQTWFATKSVFDGDEIILLSLDAQVDFPGWFLSILHHADRRRTALIHVVNREERCYESPLEYVRDAADGPLNGLATGHIPCNRICGGICWRTMALESSLSFSNSQLKYIGK